MQKTSLFITLVLLILPVLPACKNPPPGKPVSVAVSGSGGEVNFLAMGDWGSGGAPQKLVAETLASYAQKQGNIQSVLLVGDNFYGKLSSVDDPTWKSLFEDMYDRKRLPMPFYALLGNHDWEANKAQIELDYSKTHPDSRWKMPARWYRLDYPLVSLFLLDSTRSKFTSKEWADQLAWTDRELANVPRGVWKVCLAHHPLFTNGHHGDNGGHAR